MNIITFPKQDRYRDKDTIGIFPGDLTLAALYYVHLDPKPAIAESLVSTAAYFSMEIMALISDDQFAHVQIAREYGYERIYAECRGVYLQAAEDLPSV